MFQTSSLAGSEILKAEVKLVKIGIWQGKEASTVEKSLEQLEAFLEMCQKRAAEILILPEMFLGGYHVMKPRPTSVSMLKKIGELAKKYQVGIVFGCCTEEYEEGQYYSTAFAVDQFGEIVCKYHKRHLFGKEEEFHLCAGKQIPEPFVIAGMRINLLLSWDIEHPEDVAQAADDYRAQLLIVPAANTAPYEHINDLITKARALETNSFIIYCNWAQSNTVEHLPQFGFNGRSCAVNPKGKFIARFNPDDPDGIIYLQIPTSGFDDAASNLISPSQAQQKENDRIEHLFDDLGLSHQDKNAPAYPHLRTKAAYR